MRTPEQIPHPLSIELRDTIHCHELAELICEFENFVFGPDFACPVDSIRSWFDSGCLFCAAVCGEAVPGRERILSVMSTLLTTERARDQLLLGEIMDTDLRPWSKAEAGDRPSLYFASVISDHPDHLRTMYHSLAGDIETFLTAGNLEPRSAFAVASGEAGFGHMARNGFIPAPGGKYRGRYTLMTLDYPGARTSFWQRLLRTAELRAQNSGVSADPHAHPLVSEPEPTILEAAHGEELDPREVERRLALSKAERYRQMTPRRSY